MDNAWSAYAAALSLGAIHALEVDHMVAVTTIVASQPRVTAAISFGVWWGLGHGVAVLLVGGALALSGVQVPAGMDVWAELVVGLALVSVGSWAAVQAGRLHLHDPRSHDGHGHLHAHPASSASHSHSHSKDPGRRHRHALTLVGAVHGLAGTAPVVALIPVTLLPSTGAALGYLVAFGVGTTMAMGAYAALAGMAASKATSASIGVARKLGLLTAAVSVLVGIWWIGLAVAALR
jgi:hypothetical protein